MYTRMPGSSAVKVIALAVIAAGCAPRGDTDAPRLMEQGRQYTAWLYGSQYDKLWDRFSPEMRQTFGSVADLASFAGRALTRLGPERGVVEEDVDQSEPFRIYTRRASFDHAAQRMLIEWSLARDGAVTGFVVRPETGDQ